MEKLVEVRNALSALTIYRNILEDRLVCGYAALLEATEGADLRGFTNAYGSFIYGLSSGGAGFDFAAQLCELLRYDDNAFSRQAAERPLSGVDPLLREAARHDLGVVAAVMGLSAAELKTRAAANFADSGCPAGLIEGLPEFKTGMQLAPDGALEELARFYLKNGCGQFARFGAFKWQGGELLGIGSPDLVRVAELKGYEYERGLVVANTLDFLGGGAANNLLLYGDRGTGKSSTVKAVFNEYRGSGLRIIEVTKECITEFPLIVGLIAGLPLKFILFIDDLSFSSDDASFSELKAVLEGGLATRPRNCLIYATSNRRHLVRESFSERESDDVHAADTMQEKLSLADRFGITVTFSAPDQRLYLQIVGELALGRGLDIPREALERGAVQWAIRFNGRSPRAAKQYVDWAQCRLKNGQPVTDF